MLNVAPQKERISDHLRAMAEQDDKSAAARCPLLEDPRAVILDALWVLGR